MRNIQVSVICLAYNHEKYIHNALEGFVNQKTTFAYEVLIHDDASTDHTAEIIRSYAERYPEIIRPVYQIENQYSKKVPIYKTFLEPMVRGKYIALCEGDDYWTDPLKLQKQYDLMESHPDASACYHNTLVHVVKSGKEYITPNVKELRSFSFDEIIPMSEGRFMLSSTFCRKELYNYPKEFTGYSFGDVQLVINFASHGKVYCLSDVMSTYINGHEGSWTDRVLGNPEIALNHRKTIPGLYLKMDEYYGFKHHDAFQKQIDWQIYSYLKLTNDEEALKQDAFKKFMPVPEEKPSGMTLFKSKLGRRFPILVNIKHLFAGNS